MTICVSVERYLSIRLTLHQLMIRCGGGQRSSVRSSADNSNNNHSRAGSMRNELSESRLWNVTLQT